MYLGPFIIQMDRQELINNVLSHFETPHHYGTLEGADVVTSDTNPGCGDVITIYLKVGPDKHITAASFQGEGCTISQAATSILMDMIQGKSLAEIKALDYNDILNALGKDVVLTRISCATLGLKTLQQAVDDYQQHQPSLAKK